MVLRDRISDPFVYPPWMFWLRWLSMSQWVELFFGGAEIFFLYYGIKIEAKATEEEQKGDNQDDIPDFSV